MKYSNDWYSISSKWNEMFVDMIIWKELHLLRFTTQFIIDLMDSSNDVVRHSENNRLRFDLIDRIFQVVSNYISKTFCYVSLLCSRIIVTPALSVILLNGIDIYWPFAHQNKIRNATECHYWLGNIFTVIIYNAK